MSAEGWYVDPFGTHEARWFSDGQPMALVRDRATEGHDAPTGETFSGPLTPIDEEEPAGPKDMRRAGGDDLMSAEGWYVDPFGAHAARWFSGGVPTSLVRDDGQESHDDPPPTSYGGSLVPIPDGRYEVTDDRRADDNEPTWDPRDGPMPSDLFEQQLFLRGRWSFLKGR